MDGKLKIAISADHGGYGLKEYLKKHLLSGGHEVKDYGSFSEEPCDYPLLGYKAAKDVSMKKADFAIVICKTGFGMAISANKVKGVRSAVCDSVEEAESARRHNDCNALSLAATRLTDRLAAKITDVFISTPAEGGRHARRVKQISTIERKK